ncbi:ribosome silencing factor [Limnohabitans sp. TS-CS-82]|uniref:ribosome silencing factor n=1 Tax=Limnohabitans sp. TS-CS-82 TaxID=2094193 RepID=UPI000CF2A49A|nr:ribosome silencing factor [Limnohabitans sp. TS-CS-82]PQA81518.1 ribosome silencing factor [Limnohabitans sp. TS-CS-82]
MTETAGKKDVQKLQRIVVDALEDVKAQDLAVFDTEQLSSLFERVIIASGTSNRQTKALAASVRDKVREAGFSKPRIEGEDNGEWIIVDCGAVVVHVMQPTIRGYYNLEEIWGSKPVRLKFGAPKPAAPEPKEPAPKKAAAKKAGAKSTGKSADKASDKAFDKAAPKAAGRSAAAKSAPAKTTSARSATKPAAKSAAPKAAAAKTTAARKPAAKTADKPAAKLPVKTVGLKGAKSASKAAARTASTSAGKPAGKPAGNRVAAKKTPARKA